jgi:hypothetical protein
MYGNTDSETPEEYRLFPFIMSKLCPFFSYQSSRFTVQKSKASTARITMWKELGIPSVHTIEASFMGPSIAENLEGGHFTPAQLMEIGKNMCQAVKIYYQYKVGPLIEISKPLDIPNSKKNKQIQRKQTNQNYEKQKVLAQDIINEIKNNKELLSRIR